MRFLNDCITLLFVLPAAAISNPFLSGYGLMRNPAFSDKGEFFTLSEFLTFAKNQSVSGILLKIKVTF